MLGRSETLIIYVRAVGGQTVSQLLSTTNSVRFVPRGESRDLVLLIGECGVHAEKANAIFVWS